ncbi:MAG TPA: MBL fold metallo-hydrolase [Caulobacteraceae bacterium]|jgi:L-ascorbate metabolism protein UlaG (beta-lactamase superfamily)|nr:MBL fold metallo-hydrolase [Caulobacteraceae bacterium]
MTKTRALACAAAVALMLAAAPSLAAAPALTGDKIATSKGDLTIHPVNHASFVMSYGGKTIYNDPVGGAAAFAGLPRPDLILVTDIHGDHMDAPTLAALGNAPIVAPPAVRDALPAPLKARVQVLANGASGTFDGVPVQAVAAYNTTPDRLQFHAKGRGNGYVLTFGDKRVYIAGDTEETPEMDALKSIDVAFMPMNLPYTMTVEQAAHAVAAFKPKIVYPYHSRGSDVPAFAKLVGTGADVRIRAWY